MYIRIRYTQDVSRSICLAPHILPDRAANYPPDLPLLASPCLSRRHYGCTHGGRPVWARFNSDRRDTLGTVEIVLALALLSSLLAISSAILAQGPRSNTYAVLGPLLLAKISYLLQSTEYYSLTKLSSLASDHTARSCFSFLFISLFLILVSRF